MRHVAFLLLATLLASTTAACDSGGSGADQAEGATAEAVLPGKADDYLSPTAREYLLWGMGDLTLDAEWADRTLEEREAEAARQMEYRFKAYAHFVNVYVTDKSSHDDNEDYGGFAGLIRGDSLDFVYEPLDDEGMTWLFLWEVEMGGPQDLMDRLPMAVNADGDSYFPVTMPVLSGFDLERGYYPRDFDPAQYDGEVQEIEVLIDPVEASADAWPEYQALFSDDLLDVLILVGGDYNEERYDRQSAEKIFAWLQGAGYAHEAETLDDLTLESAPFTRTLDVQGRDVQVAVTLLHPDIVEDADLPLLEDRIREAWASHDVLIYDGHAGQDPGYSGVVYHYDPRRAIKADDFAAMDLPEKYQLFVFNGCKTYSVYPKALYEHAGKDTANADVVSTVNYSWLSMQPFTTSGLLVELLDTEGGTHAPRTFREILGRINESHNANVYYGVHGLDDNPHLHPWADTSSLCAPCQSDAACPGAGNLCVGFSSGDSACAAACTADDGCPEGYVCGEIAIGGRITGRQCLPATFSCE